VEQLGSVGTSPSQAGYIVPTKRELLHLAAELDGPTHSRYDKYS
jgi:hypothetical protein